MAAQAVFCLEPEPDPILLAGAEILFVDLDHLPHGAPFDADHGASPGQARFPDIDLSLREMNTFEQLEALRSRRIDLGIVRSPLGQPGFESECLVREPFVLAIPQQHPLAELPRLTLAALDGQPVIMYSLSGWQPFYELLAGMFRAAGIARILCSSSARP
jgi:DNA-binding transcriptional LysR family regulator